MLTDRQTDRRTNRQTQYSNRRVGYMQVDVTHSKTFFPNFNLVASHVHFQRQTKITLLEIVNWSKIFIYLESNESFFGTA